MDTRAPSDRTITLMHYVAKVIREKYPEALHFLHELNYLKKAAAGMYLVTPAYVRRSDIKGTTQMINPECFKTHQLQCFNRIKHDLSSWAQDLSKLAASAICIESTVFPDSYKTSLKHHASLYFHTHQSRDISRCILTPRIMEWGSVLPNCRTYSLSLL